MRRLKITLFSSVLKSGNLYFRNSWKFQKEKLSACLTEPIPALIWSACLHKATFINVTETFLPMQTLPQSAHKVNSAYFLNSKFPFFSRLLRCGIYTHCFWICTSNCSPNKIINIFKGFPFMPFNAYIQMTQSQFIPSIDPRCKVNETKVSKNKHRSWDDYIYLNLWVPKTTILFPFYKI